MNTALLLDPLFNTHLGFHRLFHDMEKTLNQTSKVDSFPPYNVIRVGNDYIIELAIAGFKRDQITIQHDVRNGNLTVQSVKQDPPEQDNPDRETAREYLRRGIGTRSFFRSWAVADDLTVASAELEDGILTIHLKAEERPENKPLQIAIK